MNIGIVTTWFERGAAYVSRAYAETLSKENSIFIYARGGEAFGIGDPKWDIPNVNWTTLGSVVIDKRDFIQWIRQNEIQLIFFNEQEHWWPPVLWANEVGVKTITYVDYYTKRMLRWFEVFDALWCNTKRHYSVFKWHPGALYLPWGTDVELFQPQRRIPNKNLIFFHSAGMGGFNLRKGTDILVQSFQKVKGPAELIIHSQVPAETYGSDISKLISADKRIRFIHKTVPMPGLYHLGDVYVYPNRLDGLGLSVTEALACGLPVICTDSAPCNEIVIPGVTGWCVPIKNIKYRVDKYYWPETECDVLDLAQKMQHCVDNRQSLSVWQEKARRFAEEHLDWAKNSALLLEEVNRIMEVTTRKISRTIKWDVKNFFSPSPSIAWRIYKRLAHPKV